MIAPHGQLQVYVATRPVDFRKGKDGLALAVQEMTGLDPFCGAAFVFRAKHADRIKILIWDRTGMVFGAMLEPVAHSPLTAQAPRKRHLRVAAGAGGRDEDVAGAVLRPVRRDRLEAGPARSGPASAACGLTCGRVTQLRVRAWSPARPCALIGAMSDAALAEANARLRAKLAETEASLAEAQEA
jgi:transposase